MALPDRITPIDDYVGKWRAREPEMEIGELFVPASLRPRFRAWGALLFELREAAFELSDARVIAAKSGWWVEELVALAQGRARHPVTHALLGPGDPPWTMLARGLAECAQDDSRPADRDAALAGMMPLARGIVAMEAALFDGVHDADAERAVAVHLLLHRLLVGLTAEDAGRVPLSLLARHGVTAAELAGERGLPVRRDWARELAGSLPARLPRAGLYRRLSLAFDRQRLARLARRGRLDAGAGPATAWHAWRAARRG
ncbi:MAG: hypothetical protein ACK4RW_07405 [Rehaibacterium terrae]|uniref:hypothetical protein n=1 Tax=Rehaibacterium terrae TaxID=1341696 RepID=UPI00391D11A3